MISTLPFSSYQETAGLQSPLPALDDFANEVIDDDRDLKIGQSGSTTIRLHKVFIPLIGMGTLCVLPRIEQIGTACRNYIFRK
jgi:hypothetical protein